MQNIKTYESGGLGDLLVKPKKKKEAQVFVPTDEYIEYINDFAAGVNERAKRVERNLWELSIYLLKQVKIGMEKFQRKPKWILSDLEEGTGLKYHTLYQYYKTAEFLENRKNILDDKSSPGEISFTTIRELAIANIPIEKKNKIYEMVKKENITRPEIQNKIKEVILTERDSGKLPPEYEQYKDDKVKVTISNDFFNMVKDKIEHYKREIAYYTQQVNIGLDDIILTIQKLLEVYKNEIPYDEVKKIYQLLKDKSPTIVYIISISGAMNELGWVMNKIAEGLGRVINKIAEGRNDE